MVSAFAKRSRPASAALAGMLKDEVLPSRPATKDGIQCHIDFPIPPVAPDTRVASGSAKSIAVAEVVTLALSSLIVATPPQFHHRHQYPSTSSSTTDLDRPIGVVVGIEHQPT